MEPVRTCLGCRGRDSASSLVRVVLRDGAVAADASGTISGRGAWVHPRVECVDSSLKRRAFGRALRADGPLEVSGLRESVLALNQSEPSDGAP